MKEIKYTPGPWKTVDATHGFRAPCEDGANDIAIISRDSVCPCIVWDFGKEGEANARLIAAAPELLEACRLIENTDKPGMSSDERFDAIVKAQRAAQEAITKAEGGEG